MSTAPAPSLAHAGVADAGELAATAIGRALAGGGSVHVVAPTASLAQSIAGVTGLASRRPVAVGGPSRVAALRASVAPGDAVVIAGESAVDVEDLCLRATAWGVTTLLLSGDVDRPRSGVADHVVHRPGSTVPAIAEDLGSTLAGLGFVPGPRDTARGEVCITCADEGIVMEVVSPLDAVTVVARSPDGEAHVDTTLTPDVATHDLLLVHAGMAIAQLDPTDRGGHT